MEPLSCQQIAWDEISRHNTKDDCWVVVDGVVYDMTEFLDDHPGGKRLPVKHSGRDVTEIWNSFHGKQCRLVPAACSALVDASSLPPCTASWSEEPPKEPTVYVPWHHRRQER